VQSARSFDAGVMQVAILGAHGQVGRAVAALLDRHHIAYRAFGRAQCDVGDADAVRRAVAGASVAVNCAAYTAVDRAETEEENAYRANALGAQHIARACAQAAIALIHISTDYVFDGENQQPAREDDPARPLNAYGRSKLAGEQKVRECLARHIILRTSWVFSATGENFFTTVVRLAKSQPELRMVADQTGGPTAATDVAEAIVAIARACTARDFSAWGTYHFCGAPPASWYELARAIVGPRAVPVIPVSTADFPRPARRPRSSVLDCSKIARTFGIMQPDWREAVAKLRNARQPRSSSG
jgi:dTDP-4-dehydrorhamnose reductase